jgi:superfamily II DNA helicase RecQ
MSSSLEILTTVFGYHAFRGQQAAIIDRAVAGGDALVIMPTGVGRSRNARRERRADGAWYVLADRP